MRELLENNYEGEEYLKEVKGMTKGNLIKQNYRIKDVIGVGGTGTTLLAYD
jgi:hypothetical protein